MLKYWLRHNPILEYCFNTQVSHLERKYYYNTQVFCPYSSTHQVLLHYSSVLWIFQHAFTFSRASSQALTCQYSSISTSDPELIFCAWVLTRACSSNVQHILHHRACISSIHISISSVKTLLFQHLCCCTRVQHRISRVHITHNSRNESHILKYYDKHSSTWTVMLQCLHVSSSIITFYWRFIISV